MLPEEHPLATGETGGKGGDTFLKPNGMTVVGEEILKPSCEGKVGVWK